MLQLLSQTVSWQFSRSIWTQLSKWDPAVQQRILQYSVYFFKCLKARTHWEITGSLSWTLPLCVTLCEVCKEVFKCIFDVFALQIKFGVTQMMNLTKTFRSVNCQIIPHSLPATLFPKQKPLNSYDTRTLSNIMSEIGTRSHREEMFQ